MPCDLHPMERIDPITDAPSLVGEHVHRYEVALKWAQGRVLDCASGTGYASKLLLGSGKVATYTGIDIDADSIAHARTHYGHPHATFLQGEAHALPFPEGHFDTILCLETLEHLDDPIAGLREFSRVLRRDGVLIGSVPAIEHDEYCERCFGKNPYHKTRFPFSRFQSVITETIGPARFYFSSMEIASFLRPIEGDGIIESGATNVTLLSQTHRLGSYIAIASPMSLPASLEAFQVRPITFLVEEQHRVTARYREAVESIERMVDDRDEAIASYQAREDALREMVTKLEGWVQYRDNVIERQKAIIESQGNVLSSEESVKQ
jgi:SAM-dependent methyltransferase